MVVVDRSILPCELNVLIDLWLLFLIIELQDDKRTLDVRSPKLKLHLNVHTYIYITIMQ